MRVNTFRLTSFFDCILSFLFLVSILLCLVGCDPNESHQDSPVTDNTTLSGSSSETSKTQDTTQAEASSSASLATADTTVASEVVNTAEMYSSYAYMVSFDPSTGLAEFDYFTMLTGEEAIDFLVSDQGYSYEDAKAEVDAFCDGEFVMKNTNSQLRTIDLMATPILSLYNADGSRASTWPAACPITYDDFVSLYEFDLSDSDGIDYVQGDIFYYVTVEDGFVTQVAQEYWC